MQDLQVIHLSFGRAVRSHRKNLTRTQAELAEACNLDRSFISDIERGRKVPTLSTIYKLAFGLGVPAAQLMLMSDFFCAQ